MTKHVYRIEVIHHDNDSDNSKQVERKIYYDEKLEYVDVLSSKEYLASLEIPDIFRMVELFSMDFISKDSLIRIGDYCIWELRRERIINKLYRPSLLKRFIRWLRRRRL